MESSLCKLKGLIIGRGLIYQILKILLAITPTELAGEISKIFTDEVIEEIIEECGLDNNMSTTIATIFKRKNIKREDFTSEDIEEALEQAWDNLIEYYSYLVKEKKEQANHECTIKQDIDNKPPNLQSDSYQPKKDRLSELIPFTKRDKKLRELNPEATCNVHVINDDNTVEEGYISYVYRNCLKDINQQQDGYLFFCEPISGNKTTRLMYLSEKEFNEFAIKSGEDKIAKIIEKYLTMSDDQFRETPKTATLLHTDISSYFKRIDFIVNGTKVDKFYNMIQRLKDLYGDQEITLPYYSSRDIGVVGAGGNTGIIDRTAQEAIKNKQNEKF